MVSFNVTVEDTSPMIVYNGEWVWSDLDPFYANYSQQSSHGTNKKNATATFKFRGSAVYLYGAKRDNHGTFVVELDNHSEKYNGYAYYDAMEFKALLYYQESLDDDDEHTLTIKNTGSSTENMSWVDIDYIVFTATDGKGGSTRSKRSRIDDTAPQWTWSPGWRTDPDYRTFGWNATQHETWTPNASVTIPFQGDAVEIHCTTTNLSGPFSIRFDDDDVIRLNAYSPQLTPDTLLYFASDFSSGPHTLTLAHAGDNNSTSICVDYIDVFEYSDTPISGREIGAIVAGTLLAIFLLLLIPLSMCIWRRYRRRKDRQLERTAQPYTQLAPSSGTPDDDATRSIGSSRRAMFTASPISRHAPSPTSRYTPSPHARFGSAGDFELNSLIRSPIRSPNGDRSSNPELHLGSLLSMDRTRNLSAHAREDSSEPLLTAAQESPVGGIARVRSNGIDIICENERPPDYSSPRPSLHAHPDRKIRR